MSNDDDSRAKYERISATSDSFNPFTPRSSTFGPRFQMSVFLLSGISLMVLHHFVNTHLDTKPVNYSVFVAFGKHVSDQTISEILGNGIAYLARTVLSAGIGVVFVQALWSQLRRKKFTLREVDAMVACRGSSFSPSAFSTWDTASSLAAIAASASLMSLITIIAPGALRVNMAEFSFSAPCTVPTVSLSTSNISYDLFHPDPSTNQSVEELQAGLGGLNLQRFAEQVYIAGSPLPPKNPCQNELGCQYDIEFPAPAATCVPHPANFNYTSWLPPPVPEIDDIAVWAGLHNDTGTGTSFFAVSRNPVTYEFDGANCSLHNATYYATVSHYNTSSSSVVVRRTEFLNDIDIMGMIHKQANPNSGITAEYETIFVQYYNLMAASWTILERNISYSRISAQFILQPLLAYSPIFESSLDDPWKTSCNVSSLISSFLANMSVSILNEFLSSEQNPSTAPFDTICWYTASRYDYDEVRLLVTYGIGIAVAAVSMLYGLQSIRVNGVEESLGFSRIVGATLNDSLFENRFDLSRASIVTMEGSTDGHLRVVNSSLTSVTSKTGEGNLVRFVEQMT
ncbi:hypothetical protein SCHPADRAFT_62447 [Schizopora paradoxa]|uniref:Uncharacterized protein n=1 Tax=Schizopora paradoxa TaxID=27342 RepID=A0A0H2SQX1_9AGAM|nr:hypothetical protein SCHPADRAFT_62447 [Schizopora paradoxa]